MIDIGKIPPQALDFEEFVLGAMMIESRCVDNVLSILKPESFYKDHNQKVFSAILELRKQSKPIDLLTVSEQLRKMKVLDEVTPLYVTQLTLKVASASHVEYHARVIQDQFIKRELIRIGTELVNVSFDESIDTEDILSQHSLDLNRVTNECYTENAELLKDLLKKRLSEIEEISAHPEKLVGVPSGLTNVDRYTGGWQKTDLIILAGRPSMGKTSLALSFALQAVSFNRPTAIFSCEMSKSQLTDKFISSIIDISPSSLRTGKVAEYQWEQINNLLNGIGEDKLFIDDTAGLTLVQLRSKVTKLLKNKIELVIIDYLQIMGTSRQKGMTRDQELGELTRGIKALAKETGLPFIVLSQLNREVEKRGEKRPQLSDLRESGSIEQDADIVMFIHRPEKYGKTELENGRSSKGFVELIFGKHRNGPVGIVEVYTNEYCSKFNDSDMNDIKPLPEIKDYYETEKDF